MLTLAKTSPAQLNSGLSSFTFIHRLVVIFSGMAVVLNGGRSYGFTPWQLYCLEEEEYTMAKYTWLGLKRKTYGYGNGSASSLARLILWLGGVIPSVIIGGIFSKTVVQSSSSEISGERLSSSSSTPPGIVLTHRL